MSGTPGKSAKHRMQKHFEMASRKLQNIDGKFREDGEINE
tara:strand:- start:141 stop:260 length:120 start_codon:yes stop_codon:yes gene_type:complete